MTLLSNCSRLTILCLMNEGGESACRLAEAFGARDTTGSQQRAVLRREMIFKACRQWQTMVDSIGQKDVGQLYDLLDATNCDDTSRTKE